MIHLTQDQLYFLINQFFWPFVRILAYLMADPLWSAGTVPRRTKVGLAVALTVVVAPLLNTVPQGVPSGPSAMLMLVEQTLIGLSLGFVVRLVFTAVEMAGHLAGLQMGLSFAAQLDPVHGTQTPVVAQLLSLFSTLLYLAMNGHLLTLTTLIQSFDVLPVQPMALSSKAFHGLALYGGQIFSLGLLLSLPVLITLLLTNIVVGLVARAAPQMNLFAVGFPITLVIGFAAIYFTLPGVAGVLGGVFDSMTHFQLELLRAMKP